MRGLQLVILISTAVVLFGIAGWAMWHTWVEQELEYEEADRQIDAMTPKDGPGAFPTKQRLVLRIHLMDRAVRGHNPANLDPEFRRGAWHQHLRTGSRVGKFALAGLRDALMKQFKEAGVEASQARGVITKEEGVPTGDVLLALNIFYELGITNVEVPMAKEEGLTSKERARKAAGGK